MSEFHCSVSSNMYNGISEYFTENTDTISPVQKMSFMIIKQRELALVVFITDIITPPKTNSIIQQTVNFFQKVCIIKYKVI